MLVLSVSGPAYADTGEIGPVMVTMSPWTETSVTVKAGLAAAGAA